MALNGSLGTGLQGVSQQQARVRLRGQVTEQVNMQSDVVRGLTSRPPAEEIAVFAGEAEDLLFDDVEIDGVKYTVGFRAGVLQVWDAAGNAFVVNTQDADAVAYIGDNMSFHVYDKTIYATNRDTVVEESAVIDTSAILSNQGLIQILGGSFGRNLTVKILYDSDGSSVEHKWNVPDSDPDEVNGDHLAFHMTDGLNGSGSHGSTLTGAKKATTTIIRTENVILITDDVETFTLTVTDGDDGSVMRQHQNTAKKLEDLARFAPHGTMVKVDGEETADDDFYMRFEVENESIVGDGFGVDGTWREWVNANEVVSYDLTTMPHVLFLVAGEFFFERNLWLSRRSGDKENNPFASFVGEKITDIGGFQSRLTFTAGANWITSRTNFPADFFKKSVVTNLDNDPIDIASTTESEVALKWMVPFDRDLLLMSEKHQFIVSGAGSLTPNNASMVLTTDFEMAGNARPSSTGRTILFPFKVGSNAGLKEFFASDEIATNGADNITETISTYIKGDVIQIATSTNFNTTLVRTDHVGSEKTVWVYKYLWEGLEKKQSSWSRWEFPYEVSYVYWDNATINIIMRDGSDYILMSMAMDYPPHAIGYIPMLDRHMDLTAGASNEVILAFPGAEFIQHTGCAAPGSRATPLSVTGAGPYTYTFDATTVPVGAELESGLAYVSSISPTEPFVRNRAGEVIGNGTLIVTDFRIFYRDSGSISSLRKSKYRGDRTFDNDTVITANDPEDPSAIGIRSGEWVIPWGERSDWADLTLTSMDLRPLTVMQIEWTGQSFTRGTLV